MAIDRLPGRPTKKTPERVERGLAVLRLGGTKEAAAAAAGVDRTTWNRWYDRFATFRTATRRAEDEGELRLIVRLKQLANQSKDLRVALRAVTFQLERRYRRRWGREERRVHTGDAKGAPIAVTVFEPELSSPPAPDAIRARLAERAPTPNEEQ